MHILIQKTQNTFKEQDYCLVDDDSSYTHKMNHHQPNNSLVLPNEIQDIKIAFPIEMLRLYLGRLRQGK